MTELVGKTLGIVGLGNIGSRVAEIARTFGMKVVAYTSKQEFELPLGVEKRSLTELLRESDVVSLHCPLAAGTHHLINCQTLHEMKPSAILINTGRGPLVNEQDVANALNENRLRAYCADVLSEEPPHAGHSISGRLQNKNSLLRCENAFITPHIAWATKEARMRLIEVAINNVKAFVAGKPQNTVQSEKRPRIF